MQASLDKGTLFHRLLAEQTEDKRRMGCYETCEGCANAREDCTCPCSLCGGLGYIVTTDGPFHTTGKRDCHVCNYE